MGETKIEMIPMYELSDYVLEELYNDSEHEIDLILEDLKRSKDIRETAALHIKLEDLKLFAEAAREELENRMRFGSDFYIDFQACEVPPQEELN